MYEYCFCMLAYSVVCFCVLCGWFLSFAMIIYLVRVNEVARLERHFWRMRGYELEL